MDNNKFYIRGNMNVQIPAHINFGKYMLERLRSQGDKIALINSETGEKTTYSELTQYSVDLAESLKKLGVGVKDVVALGSEKRKEVIPTALAIILTGATYTPYESTCGRAVLKHKLSIAQPKVFICSEVFWQTHNDILTNFESVKTVITLDSEPVTAVSLKSLLYGHCDVNNFEAADVQGQSDVACILYSSGTTGMPKGVELSHLNCILASLVPENFQDETLKTVLICGEWYHNYDTFMTFKSLSAGKEIVYLDEIAQDKLMKSIEKYKVNLAFLVPSTINWISKTDACKYNLQSIKILYSRSSPLHLKTMERVKQRFPSIKCVLQGYGMTEAGELTSELGAPKGARPGSVGVASPGITLKVVDRDTREALGPNQRGEICLNGPVLMKCYVGVDPSTYLDKQGFFSTGDLGYYTEDGYFYIVDRLKEIIVYDGFNIAPLELETILLLHPEVHDAGVVGKPVENVGEVPAAFVVTQPGSDVTEQELIDYVAFEVSAHMQLKGGIRFISEIPRSPRGKILRRHLRDMLNETK